MTARRASVTAVAAVMGCVVLVALLVTWAASIGPSGVLTGQGPGINHTTMTDATSESSEPFQTAEQDPQRRLEQKYAGDRPWLRTIALVLEILAALALLYVAWRIGRWAHETWQARRRPPPDPEDIEFDVIGASRAAMTDQLGRDAAAQREALLGGTPRNGIVECWHRFEVQAAAAGLARHPWETSSEFTLRMLDLVGADTSAVQRLAGLYREARFSEHEVGEDVRQRALEALADVHRGVFGRVP
jgi:hypothetical protein